MSKNKKPIFIIVVLLLLLFFSLRSLKTEPLPLFSLDSFAKCLAEKQITMYGAYWCTHCQNQKKMFGDSFRYVPYIECTKEPQKCLAAGVTSYPTWISSKTATDAATPRLSGEVSLDKLAGYSGCPLPKE